MELPSMLHPLALLCLQDILRPEVRETVRYFGEQGAILKVISGDGPLTAANVAAQAGLPSAERMIDLPACEMPVYYVGIVKAF